MINLLPPKEKNILLKEKNFRLVLVLEIILLVFLICLILVLLQVKIYISGRAEYQKALLQAETEASAIQELRKKINLANQSILAMKDFYQQSPDLTGILEKISGKILPGMYLTSISYNQSTSRVSLFGFSPTRALLVGQFKERLEEDFADIHLPEENLLKKYDVDFVVNFKIND